ncbi:unnamed protein product [Medioppia subpectinata]|uniref:Rac GTPase-activating protein 1 n=1 Tax=Medioppia subpectinata TaxID=1979941 RepID=A0A7R9L2G4_9ACAR|nr:unnamed protein product [Medioppia subpectinata]CAG2114178.1 unnamed protein product [Medioppia subpectinata]
MQSTVDGVEGVDVGSGGPKLSLVAQFDDMCRFGNSLIAVDEQSLMDLLAKCETNRLRWLSTQRELMDMKSKCRQLEEQNRELVSNLKHVRFGFGKEVQNREDLLKQRNALRNQLNAIKDFVLKDSTATQSQETRDKVLSYLNLNHLETVKEDTNESMDGLDYDVSEDNILSESVHNNRSVRNKRKSTECDMNAERAKYANRRADDIGGDRMAPKAVFDDNTDLDSPTLEGPAPRTSLNVNQVLDDRYAAVSKSSPHIPNSRRLFVENHPQNLSPIFSTTPLEERKHNLIQKKAFKPAYCGPCREAIGFFGTFMCCEDCRVICHIKCKSRLPVPCIPFRKPNGKSSQMVLIADFAPQQTRPMIPALIIHICNEIERRGLDEEGLYRKCGSDKDIRELKEKLLKAKTGMFGLISYDVHVLCGVLKLFLKELDEPIVTRILWRDFVRASDQENPDEEKALIMQTVEELPTANRDSLSFIMVHLMRVANCDGNRMDTRSLAKVFGPTIVGHSMIEPPITEILAENPKQIKVMEALFRIPEDYWNGVLTSVNSWETNRFGSPDRRAQSNGRLMGTIQRGTLTPLRSTSQSRGALSLKPFRRESDCIESQPKSTKKATNKQILTNKVSFEDKNGIHKTVGDNDGQPRDPSNDHQIIEAQINILTIRATNKQILTNKVSFEDKNGIHRTVGDNDGQPRDPSNDHQIIEALRQVVRTCTAPDSSKRPSASEINHLLNAYL